MATTDSTGSEFYLVASSTLVATKANCTSAIAAGKKIAKVRNLGDIGGTRAVSEIKYLSNDDTEKSIGSVSYGNLQIETPFDAADTAGQNDMRTMFNDKSARILIIKNTDGNFTTLPVKCSSAMKTYAIDEMVMFKGTLEINGAHTEVTA